MHITKKNCHIFKLEKDKFITIKFDLLIEEIFRCDDIQIKFNNSDKSLLLANDCMLYLLREFKTMLEDALDTNLTLHKSITQNIGFMNNQNMNNNPNLTYEKHEGQNFWVGSNYSLWGTPGNARPNLTTWLYNDKNKNIVMEITPNYPWHFQDPEPTDNYVSYESFMKNYNSYLTQIIPPETACKWIKQIDYILKIAKENENSVNTSNAI